MTTAKHTILFVVDGMRPDGLRLAHTPTIDRLATAGAYTWQAQTVTPSISLPCHSSMFRSVPPARHGVTANLWTPRLPLVPSIIDVVHQAGLGTASFYTWEPLRDLSSPDSLDLAHYLRLSKPPQEEDREIAAAAADYLIRRRPAFTFVYLGATDETGHRHGWMSTPYLEAISTADQAIALVLDAVQRAGLAASTACLVQADHGGHEQDHAAGLPEDLTIPWILCGTGIRQGHQIAGPVTILDTSPTLLHLLGVPAPAEWQGRPVVEALLG